MKNIHHRSSSLCRVISAAMFIVDWERGKKKEILKDLSIVKKTVKADLRNRIAR